MGEEEKEKEFYTQWFNVDQPWTDSLPWHGAGDYETIDQIQRKKNLEKICEQGYSIIDAECRLAMGPDHEVFTSERYIDTGNVLYRNCTREEGLVCRARDQPQGQMCHDYAIRFKCGYHGNTNDDAYSNLFPEFDARIYLVLATVPVLIFLIRVLWVYVFRRRYRRQQRQQRRQRRRAGQARPGEEDISDDDDDNESINSDLARPPPAYTELFKNGVTPPSVFAISGGAVTACPKCKDAQCSFISSSNRNSQQQSGDSQSRTPQTSSPPTTQDTSRQTQENNAPASSTSNDDNASSSGSRSESSSENRDSRASNDIPLQDILESVPTDHSSLEVVNETREGHPKQTTGLTSPSSPQTDLHSPVTLSTISLETQLNSNNTQDIPADVQTPCACACHQTSPPNGRGSTGYVNAGFTPDTPSGSNGSAPYRGRHIPAIPRPVSGVSLASQITLSELPSYEDALKLEKKYADANNKDS